MKQRLITCLTLWALGCAGGHGIDPADEIVHLADEHEHWGHDEPNEAEDGHGASELADVDQLQTRGVRCSSRWAINAPNAPNQSVSYQGPGGSCSGRAQSGAREFGERMRTRFGHLMNLSVLGRGVQIYNCRTVAGSSAPSIHGDGRAVDLFIPVTAGNGANNVKGDEIANWLVDNAARIGIQYIIWDRTSWRARDNRDRCYTGRHAHHDHIHVELTWAAARMETPFFDDADDDLQDRHERPVPPTEDGRTRTPEPEVTTWLGEPCERDADCGFTVDGVRAACLKDAFDPSIAGVCSVPCAGFCADRQGSSTTFCAAAEVLGHSGGGYCVAQSTAQNGRCQGWDGFAAFQVDRHRGHSSARARTATVCLPERAASPAPPPSSTPDELGACGGLDVPLTDHNRPCPGVPHNTWRCGCSERFSAPVSQVCRDGKWVSFQLNPRDCQSCSGRYSSACD